jgi:hypothetical protein
VAWPRQSRLLYRWEPGASLRYRVVATFDGTAAGPSAAMLAGVPGSGSASVAGRPYHTSVAETLAIRVVSVDAHGTALMDVRVVGARLNGEPQSSVILGDRVRLRVATDGRVVSAWDPGVLVGPTFPGMDQLFPVVSGRTVASARTWRKLYTQELPLGTGSVPFSARGSFVGPGDVGGLGTFVIRSSSVAPVEVTLDFGRIRSFAGGQGLSPDLRPTIGYSGRVSSTARSWFDPEAGRLVRSEQTGRFDMTLDYEGFPSLFPTFEPSGVILPFGGAGVGGGNEFRLTGTFRLSLEAIAP